MKIINEIKTMAKDQKIDIYVDMDGVIAEYDFGRPLDFLNKRPLLGNIKVLEEISKIPNVEMHILSICKKDSQINDKNVWLDKYAPFFKKENRNVLSKETYTDRSSSELKVDFLNNVESFKILIDDDNGILKEVDKKVKNISLYQDSSIVY